MPPCPSNNTATVDSFFVFVVDNERCSRAQIGNETRKKRPHHKSRHGCVSCKRRRVKCDGLVPCSNCTKRKELCVQGNAVGGKSKALVQGDVTIRQMPDELLPPSAVADDPVINLLHMELFHKFHTRVAHTLSFQQIWPCVIQWSFQEPFIMSAILCLSATHLAAAQSVPSRYSQVALQLWTKSASLLRNRLSDPIETDSAEKLISSSILMQYIAWSHIHFLDEQKHYSGHLISSYCIDFSQDPLFTLNSGIRDLYFEAFPTLLKSHSHFFSTALYSPRLVIEETLEKHGLDPGAYLQFFTSVWDDSQFRVCSPPSSEQPYQPPSAFPPSSLDNFEGFLNSGQVHNNEELQERLASMVDLFKILSGYTVETSLPRLLRRHDGMTVPPLRSASIPQHDSDAHRTGFRIVSRGVSIAMCLASLLSDSESNMPSNALSQLQPDIERYLFSLPTICIGTFRDLASQGDARALVVLLHFYRATQMLLPGDRGWWAQERCRVMQRLIWKDLKVRGLDTYAQAPGWVGNSDHSLWEREG